MTDGSAIEDFAENLKHRRTGGMISAWIGIPDPLLANFFAQEPFDAVVIDMQHGMWDMPTAATAIGQVRLAGKPAVGRIPVGDFASASRMLDAGASGIIAPMINSGNDAREFVKATKYLPLGERSWGPALALNYNGLTTDAYLKTANRTTVAIAMVETREALGAIDDILAVDGIDGIFIGPSDLSIALSDGAALAPNSPEIDEAMGHALERCRHHDKFICAFGGDGERAGALLKRGFHFVIAGGDSAQIRAGARAAISAARAIAGAK